MADNYPHVSVIERDSEQGHREQANAINHLLEQINALIARLELLEPYGGISAVDNSTETTITTQGVAVQVTIFDTNDPANNATPDHTNDHITIGNAGDYMIVVSATVNSVAGLASRFEMTVQKNNGASDVGALHVDRNIDGGGGKAGSVSMSSLATLAVDDTLEVWIENETNTANYIVENITLSVMQVG